MSQLSQTLWYVWVSLFLAFVALLLWMHKSAKGRLTRDRMFLRVPLVKDVVLFAVTERVCRIIGAMVKAGVPLPETLNAAIQGANNQVFERGRIYNTAGTGAHAVSGAIQAAWIDERN